MAPRHDIEQRADVARGRRDLGRFDARLHAAFVQHVHDIFRREVADRGDRRGHGDTAADAANGAFDEACAGIECCQHVGRAGACQIVHVKADFDVGELAEHAAEQLAHLPRVFHAQAAGEVVAADAGIAELTQDRQHPLPGNSPLVGAPHRHAQRHDKRHTGALDDAKRLDALRHAFVERHVLVLLVVGLAERDQPQQLVELAGQCPLGTARIGHEPAIDDTGAPGDALAHLLGVLQRRDDARVGKVGHLDDGQPRRRQPIDHRHLGVGLDPTRKRLQAIARGDVDDGGARRQMKGHGGSSSGLVQG